MAKLTPTNECSKMNAAYEILKAMTAPQIVAASAMAHEKFKNPADSQLFVHQCKYALMKKKSGAWA